MSGRGFQLEKARIVGGNHETAVPTDDVAARTDDVAARTDDVAARTDDVAVRTDDVAVRTGDVAERTDDVAVRTCDFAVRTDGVVLRTDDVGALRLHRRAYPKFCTRILALAERHGMRRVRVFASAARGDAGPTSDLDLLVDVASDRNYLDLVASWQDVEEVVGCHVDVVADGALSPYLRDKIYAEARACKEFCV